MAVLYKLYKNNNTRSGGFGQWYARAITSGTIDTDALAEIMQRNCTVKRSDILAVLAELVETTRDQLQNSVRVKLNGFGSFKIGLRTKGAAGPADFSASKNVVGMRVLFQPEAHVDAAHKRTQAFLQGARAQETAKNAVEAISHAPCRGNGVGGTPEAVSPPRRGDC